MVRAKRKKNGTSSGGSSRPDFKRIKKKVGRRAPKKLNDTDTTIRTKNIVVREQSVVTRDRGAAGTFAEGAATDATDPSQIVSLRRRMSISEMLAQANHHKGSIRRDAIEELRDTVKHYGVRSRGVSLALGTILRALMEKMSDEDKLVRAAQRSLMETLIGNDGVSSWFLPFVDLYVSHTRAAFSSLSMGVRLDALRSVDMLVNAFPDVARSRENEFVPLYASLLTAALRPPNASQTANHSTVGSLRLGSSNGNESGAQEGRERIVQRFSRVVESSHRFFSMLFSSPQRGGSQNDGERAAAAAVEGSLAVFCARPFSTLRMPPAMEHSGSKSGNVDAAKRAIGLRDSYLSCLESALQGWTQYSDAKANSRRYRSRAKGSISIPDLKCASSRLVAAVARRIAQTYDEQTYPPKLLESKILWPLDMHFAACYPVVGAGALAFQMNEAWASVAVTVASLRRRARVIENAKTTLQVVRESWLGNALELETFLYAPLPGTFASAPSAEATERVSSAQASISFLILSTAHDALNVASNPSVMQDGSGLAVLFETFADSFASIAAKMGDSNLVNSVMHAYVKGAGFLLNPQAARIAHAAASHGGASMGACIAAARWIDDIVPPRVASRLLEMLPRCIWTACRNGDLTVAREAAQVLRECALKAPRNGPFSESWSKVASRLSPVMYAQRKKDKTPLWGPFFHLPVNLQSIIVDAIQSNPVDALPRSCQRALVLCALRMCQVDACSVSMMTRVVHVPFERFACGMCSSPDESVPALLSFVVSVVWGNEQTDAAKPDEAYLERRQSLIECVVGRLNQLPADYPLMAVLSTCAISLSSAFAPDAEKLQESRVLAHFDQGGAASVHIQLKLRGILDLFSSIEKNDSAQNMGRNDKVLALLHVYVCVLLASSSSPYKSEGKFADMQQELNAVCCARFLSSSPGALCLFAEHLAAFASSCSASIGKSIAQHVLSSFCATLHRPALAAHISDNDLSRSGLPSALDQLIDAVKRMDHEFAASFDEMLRVAALR